MKLNILSFSCIAIACVLNGCVNNQNQTRNDGNLDDKISEYYTADTQCVDTAAADVCMTESHTVIRRPDMTKHVRKGSALLLETEGFRLAAIDTAVLHTATYSVTSLRKEELASLPQGMVNMTAAADGYRLLPGGDHFSPYAELRVAYDTERLPFGYTPEDIYTSYYDTAAMAWVRLERVEVDTANHEIVSLTSHFTDFINELLKAPEMPETQAFVPTAMNDLEAVSPMDGLPMIQPPTANNNGTANLSYPIVIPAGRNGMQPNLALTYSSSGGNGWLGVGWDISVPSITVDTRWGVPRNSESTETEVYLLNGEQLITKNIDGIPDPMPHRTNHQLDRMNGDIQFYARTGDTHDSIIRHGDSPHNYWWEVVDCNGVTHVYGHYSDSIFNTNHPTTFGANGRSRWMLCESKDLYGNWVRYYYNIVYTFGSNPGRQFYLSRIDYTGHGDEDGVYSIEFTCKDRSPYDIPTNCNYGYKEETTKQLCNIAIKTADTIITGYYFETECNYASNFKTRLTAVNKIDNLFNTVDVENILRNVCTDGLTDAKCGITRQEFEYFNYPALDTIFGTPQYSTVSNDNLRGFMLTQNFRVDTVNDATAFGLSHSSSWSIGGSLGVGLGPIICFSSTSIGGNYHRGKSSSESLMTLIDIDGDGLADKVFVKNGELRWRKQLFTTDGIIRFDTARTIDSISHFLIEGSTTNTFGVQASVAVASGSGSWSNSVSTTPTYFADVNGDGLIDLVDNGQVWFNRIVNGMPTFTRYQSMSQAEGDSAVVDSPITDINQCADIIFDGEVNDSVACRIYWDTCEVFATDSAEAFLQSQSSNDETIVIPVQDTDGYHVIRLCRRYDCSSRNLAMDGVPATEAVRVWVAPDSGEVTLESYVKLIEDTGYSRMQSRHADGVVYIIQHSSGIRQNGNSLHSTTDTILMSRHICETCYRQDAFDGINYDSTYHFRVEEGDIMFFRLQSIDDKQFDNIEDHIRISFNGEVYTNSDGYVLTEDKFFQAPYDGEYIIDGEYDNTDESINLEIEQPVNASPNGSGALDWTGNIEKDSVIHIHLNTDYEEANWNLVNLRARIRFWSDSLPDTITIWTPGDKHIIHYPSSIWGDSTFHRLFGSLYRGWGQFAYNPVENLANSLLIPLDSLVPPAQRLTSTSDTNGLTESINDTIPDEGFNQPTAADFTEDNGGKYSIVNDSTHWVEMLADAEHYRWVAYGAQNSIGKDTMSNSLQEKWYSAIDEVSETESVSLPPNADYDDAIPKNTPQKPTKAVRKVNRSKNQSYTLGIAGLSAAYSTGKSSIEMEYLDLNGDRYPDIVGTSFVQYRSQWGGLGCIKGLPNGIDDVIASTTSSAGFSFGASPVPHKRDISGNPSNAKFSLSGDGSIGGDVSLGWNNSTSCWMDMNGDGLPDFVSENGYVRLNTGYDFLAPADWNFNGVNSGQSVSNSVSLGVSGMLDKFDVVQGSIQLGAGLGHSVNRTGQSFIDINGDGLPDIVWRDLSNVNSLIVALNPSDSVQVKLNLGGGRWSQPYHVNIQNFNLSEGYNESLNAGATIGVTFFGTYKVTFGLNGTPYSSSVNRDRIQLVDINGDGFPDLVTSTQEGELSVRYNKAGKTNLLKKVTNFTGSQINMDYALSEPCYEQPSRNWNLCLVTTKDILNPNGGDTSVSCFLYERPRYDRLERTSYGYGIVTSKQVNPSDGSIYRTVRREFHNENIIVKGRPKVELTCDGQNHKYIEKVYQYGFASYDGGEIDTCVGYAYTLRDRIVTSYYEGADSAKLTTAEAFEYDRYHNITKYIDEGDTAYGDDGLYVDLTYFQNQLHNLIGLRSEYKVYATGDTGTNWMRRATFIYDTTGKLTNQTLFNTTGSSSYDFEYDCYGNMSKAMLPLNDSNQRMTYLYTYDSYTHTYHSKIKNSFDDSVCTTYMLYYGKPTTVTDQSGNTMTYAYDFAGRLTSVTSPLCNSNSHSVENQYYPINYYTAGIYHDNTDSAVYPHPYSITKHFDDNGVLITKTVVITDGFGRVLQTKKGLTEYGAEKMQVSGRTFVDAFGRTVRQYDPFTVPYTALYALGQFEPYMDSSATVTSYDVLDRVTEVRQPLNVTTHTAYDIGNDISGHRRFVTTTTDPNGNVTTQYADYDGHQVQVTDANGGITLMHYDNLGQLDSTSDPEGFKTIYFYDMLGRMTKRLHPDAGTTRYTYDNAGNLLEEDNPLGHIYYEYTYNRPTYKHYSYMTGNNVTYEYGISGNDRGRLWRITDGSGKYECHYDALGNVTDETRTIAMPHNDDEVYSFHMDYSYDSWGRMNRMVYPDGEEITYTYQWGGDLNSMNGNKNGDDRTYIREIQYNSFGQKEQVNYGNGTSAQYTYDALHRLAHLQSTDSLGNLMQNIDYTFDNASNVTRIANNAGMVNTLGGDYENTYDYDVLHRLIGSSGGGAIGNYNTYLTYSPSGRLIGKFRDNNSVTLSAAVDMAYGYCNDYQPHAVKRMFDYNYGMLYDMRWDEAGNLGQVSMGRLDEMFDAGRFLFWTEDNRMHAAVDDRYYSYYAYDHSGERRLKLTGDNKLLDVNADFMSTYTTLNEPTLYPSAYMVLTNKGYTKHYYAGTERVAARLGGGGLDALYHVIGNDVVLQTKADILFKQSIEQVNSRVLNENNLDCIMSNEFAKEEFGHWIDGIPYQMQAGVELNHDQFKDMVNSMLDDINHGQEKEVYFYHSDHLGSASWITDFSGVAVQHIQYLPYGEPYINQRPFGYSERFTFTGKERDEETGYGYFGARYMDHELMTMWLSVDPMSDKYPSISPYAYCAWNPVKLVDPNGEEVYMLFYTKGNKKGDGMFKAAALTRKRDIENSSSFNKDKDIVVLCGVSDLSNIQGSVDQIREKYGEKYGKTKEFDLWSHGGLDGPTGSTMTSTNRLDDGSGKNQMSMDGWSSINFDWSENARASFYGCRTGVEDNGSSFAQRLSNCENFSGVLVSGMSDYGFPSYSSSSYQKHSDDYIISENNGKITYKPTYMVSTNAMKRRFSNNCNPPNRYKNGKKVN